MEDRKTFPPLPKFLESLGFTFTMDAFGDGTVTAPEKLTAQDIAQAVAQFPLAVNDYVQTLAKRNLRQYVGGPLSGQPHDRGFGQCIIAKRIGKGRWCAYFLCKDGRAMFVDEATNQLDAKALAWDGYNNSPDGSAEYNATHFADGPLAGRGIRGGGRVITHIEDLPDRQVCHIYRRTDDGYIRHYRSVYRREDLEEAVAELKKEFDGLD